MTYEVGAKVRISTEAGTITGMKAGRRGRTLYTVKLDAGRDILVDERSIDRDIQFAPPCTPEEFFAPLPSSAAAFRAKVNR